MPEFIVRQALSEEDVLKAHVVRGIVFIEEQEVDWEGEIDEFEKESIHFLGTCNGQPVAAGRLRVQTWSTVLCSDFRAAFNGASQGSK